MNNIDNDEVIDDILESNQGFDSDTFNTLMGPEEEERTKLKKITLRKNSTVHSNRVVAHIDLDCFYVQVERSHNPDLKGKPVAVVQCKY
jgi:divalent metal cation (Fe/Co/Zn/Cd) transporter